MRRPPSEIRRLREEERRREAAHRRIRWERRRKKLLWILAGALFLAALLFIGSQMGILT